MKKLIHRNASRAERLAASIVAVVAIAGAAGIVAAQATAAPHAKAKLAHHVLKVNGSRGADVALLGDGDDTFVWDNGDGSDVVEGQDGHDTMVFNGAPGAEQFDLSANGHRLRFFRTQGAITMDTRGVERVDVNALGGA